MFSKPKSIFRNNRWIAGLGVFVALGGLVGCVSGRMAIPESFVPQAIQAKVDRSLATGWLADESARFAGYYATGLKRSWTKTEEVKFFLYKGVKIQNRYQFHINKGDELMWIVRCGTLIREGNFSRTIRLYCSWKSDKEKQSWHLLLKGENMRPMFGELKQGDRPVFQVFGTHRRKEVSFELSKATGYHFREKGHMAGAIDVMGRGIAWFRRDLQPDRKDVMACSFAALIYFKVPKHK